MYVCMVFTSIILSCLLLLALKALRRLQVVFVFFFTFSSLQNKDHYFDKRRFMIYTSTISILVYDIGSIIFN